MAKQISSRIRVGIVAGSLIVTGVIYVALLVIALRWAQLPFPGFFTDPHLIVNDSGEPTWAAREEPFSVRYPERVVAVDGQPVRYQTDWLAVLNGRSIGDEIALTLVQPPADSAVSARSRVPERTVTIPLVRFTPVDLANHFVLFYVTGLMMLVIGAWTFWVRPYESAAQVFALLMVFAALAVGTLFDALTTKYFIRLWMFALSLSCGFLVLLASVFPHKTKLVSRFPITRWLVLVPGLFVGVLSQIYLYDTGDPWLYAINWRALYLLNGVGLLVMYAIWAYRAYGSPSPLVRQQARLVLLGGVIAFAPLTFFFVGASFSWDLSWLPQAFYLPMMVIFPLSIGYAIIRYRLLNVDVVLRRGMTYNIITGLFVGGFVLVVIALTKALGLTVNLNNPFLTAVIIFLVLLAFDPLRKWLQTGLDQMFFSQPLTQEQLIQEYNHTLTTAVDVDQIHHSLIHFVTSGVPEAVPHLYLPDAQMVCYQNYTARDETMVEMGSPLVNYLRRTSKAIDLTERRAWPEELQSQESLLDAMETAVLVPMNNGSELLGWLSLAPKQNKQPYRPGELTYVNTLTNQSLIGLERANVIRRLETRVGEQNLLSQFSQALNFTIEMDSLLELIYINFQRLLDVEDLFVILRQPDKGVLYKAFHVEADERLEDCEGPDQIVQIPSVQQAVATGQMEMGLDENGRFYLAAPLNAGANSLGAIYTWFRDGRTALPERQQQLTSVFADQAALALERLQTNKQLEERAQQLEIINQLTLSLASTTELGPLLDLILDKAIELLAAEAGTFMISLPDTGELEFQVVRGPASADLLGTRLPIGTGLAGTAAQTGRPIITNKVQDDRRWYAGVSVDAEYKTESILTVPLIRQNTVLGVLQIINKLNGALFDEEDQQLLSAFAGQAVVAMENARLLQQTDEALRQSVDELSMLQQLDRDLNTTLELDHVLDLTLSRTLHICHGTTGAILLLDDEEEPYRYVTQGYDATFKISKADFGTGLIGRVLRSKKPDVCNNVHEDEDYVAGNFHTHSQLTLPLIHKQNLLGAIAIESDELDAFSPQLLETAVRVTNHAVVAIANAVLIEKVNEANLAKSEFVSMVSHELKTPMTSMRGFTDLMLSGMTGSLTDQQRKFLETIALNIRRMGQQIQDLTDISRIETGRLYMDLQPTSIVPAVNDTLQTIKPLCDDKGIRLHLNLPDDLPMVMADKDRLIQVMTNLLSNACKYSPPDTDVSLSFSTYEGPSVNGNGRQPMLLCSVADQGYGISQQDLERLFTKFFRSEDPNIRQAPGTGLGLSITRGIIELQGGEIWVESEVGKGTTFSFTIPQAKP